LKVGASVTEGLQVAAPPGRIGPNAILRLIDALESCVGRDRMRQVFEIAGQARYLGDRPATMVDERAVTSLYTTLPAQLGVRLAAEVSAQAGRLTGDYLLAQRIPAPVRVLLRALPASVAARVLVPAIRRHAWTFAGTGRFAAAPVHGRTGARAVRWRLRIEHCPICRGCVSNVPGCSYYAATFERIFAALVHRGAAVREVECEAQGAPACLFEVSW
jgi:divinyl protochlorophyllide a 8-vinyl-reductase